MPTAPGEIPLDVSALEAPEPFQRAVEAVQGLPPGHFLHMYHRMQPLHLYPWLARQGFASDTRQGRDGCEVFIWRRDDEAAARAAGAAAAALPPWQG
jgi:hypothetical protein